MQTPVPEENPRNLDPWSRLRLRLREIQRLAAHTILTGNCEPDTYHRLCGEHGIAGEILELMEEVGRGQDIRPPPDRLVFNPRSIEDC